MRKLYVFILFICSFCLSGFAAGPFSIVVRSSPSSKEPRYEVKKVIPLQTAQNALIDRYYSVTMDDDHIVVNDMAKCVIFDHEGKIISVIKKQGQGPAEYMQIRDVKIVNNALWLFDAQQRKIVRFDMTGRYISTTGNIPGLQMTLYENHIFQDRQGYREANKACVRIADLDGKTIHEIIQPINPKFNVSARKKFIQTGNELLYLPSFSNVVYSIHSTGKFSEKWRFDFGSHNWSLKEFEEHSSLTNGSQLSNYARENEKVIYLNFNENPSWIVLDYYLGKDKYYWYYNKQTKEQYALPQSKKNSPLTFDIQCTYKDLLVTGVEAGEYMESLNSMKKLNLSEEDNPVIILYKL